MSECVVRMEMPKNCETCRLRFNDSPTNVPDWICAINQWPTFYCKKSQNHADEDKYLQDCPIIRKLPEGHGRLIDASTIIGEVDAWYTDDYGNPIPVNRPISVDDYLGLEVPTLVPAERSET